MRKPNILVLCTGNSCRSQMAHGYLDHFLKGQANVYSAGIETHGLNQKAVAILQEDGIDISHNSSNLLSEYDNIAFDYIITVCDHAAENCPYIPGEVIRLHHNFSDPGKVSGTPEVIEKAFLHTREAIKVYVLDFVNTYFSR